MKTMAGWVLAVFLSLLNLANAQSIRVGIGGGLGFLKEGTVYSNALANQGYGFGPIVFSYSGITKIGLPLQRLNIVLGFSYIPLSGNDSPYLLFRDRNANPDRGTISDTRAKLFEASLGPEWYLLKEGMGPHIGFRVQLVQMGPITSKLTAGLLTHSQRIDGWTRVGAGITGGIEVPEGSTFSVDIRGHYNFNWLFEESNGEPGLDAWGVGTTLLVSIL